MSGASGSSRTYQLKHTRLKDFITPTGNKFDGFRNVTGERR
jgi:hypothetical protein